MAPTLTSNSFLLSTTPHPRLSFKNPRFTVSAKKSGQNQEATTNSGNPFNFDFGNECFKLRDQIV